MARQARGTKTGSSASISVAAWKWTFGRFRTMAVLSLAKINLSATKWQLICFATGAFSLFPAAHCLNAANCATGAPGLVGWWPGDGNARDIAGTNNGNLQGGASATSPGVVGSAFSF